LDDLKHRLQAALSDRYTVQRELGHGSMATVYLAHDVKHDRLVALKALHPNLAATLGADTNSASDWLERALEERAHQLAWIKVDPRLDPLRGTASFDRLLERMKLADLTSVP
jgi:serine/threonine protein kinase